MERVHLDDLAPTTRESLQAGISLFNEQKFWEAHEAWEDAWLVEQGASRLFLQALIQLAAAYHKGLRMGSAAGMARLFAAAAEKFERLARTDGRIAGLDMRALATAARQGQLGALAWADARAESFAGHLVVRLTAGTDPTP